MLYFLLVSGAQTRTLTADLLPQRLLLNRLLTTEQALTLPAFRTRFIHGDANSYKGEEPYPDVFCWPAYLVSDGIRRILIQYDRALVGSAVVLIDKESRQEHVYWMMGFAAIDCLSVKTVYDKRGYVQEPVLDQTKIPDKAIFKVGGPLDHYLILRLDAAESLLRRPFYGLELIPVRTEQDEEESICQK